MHHMIRTIGLMLGLGALLALPTACGGGSGEEGPKTQPVSTLKTADWRSRIGQEVLLRGYLAINTDGTGTLRDGRDAFFVNAPYPQTEHVVLAADLIDKLDPNLYAGALVDLRGEVRESTSPGKSVMKDVFGDLSLCEVRVTEILDLVEPGTGLTPRQDPCDLSPLLCSTVTKPDAEKFALLYSGGIDAGNNKIRYWNDLVLYYRMLVNVLNYHPDNVIVVYKDGTADDDAMPVHYPATRQGVTDAQQQLLSGMNAVVSAEFFLFMTNHGDTQPDADSPTPGDESVDEVVFWYEDDGYWWDEEIAQYVNALPFTRMCAVLEPCYSGGLIRDMRGPNRVICAACRADELSRADSIDRNGNTDNARYDIFVRLFAEAILGYSVYTLDAVDADANDDGEVSVYEAFRFAREFDWRPETPQYEDNGDGVSTPDPDAGVTPDGTYGSTYFL